MSTVNIGWLFYRDYFNSIKDWSNINQEDIAKKVDKIIASTAKPNRENVIGNSHFKATTTYPGLILGSGYLHELPSIEGQAILGFDFDYTTGLPIIRGSSIKGVLRSAFKEEEYIKELLEDDTINVKELEIEIFGQDNGSSEVSQGKDVFFDAEIIAHGTKLLEDDYLAPHGEDSFKNPIPLRFIKVAPGVSFMFDFDLTDGIISKSKKLELFQAILEDFGVGAKTNVGYGKFDNFSIYKTDKEKELAREKDKEDKFNSIKTIEDAKEFKRNYPNYKADEVDSLIKELENKTAHDEIKNAFNNLDKTNKKYIESFIKKWQDNELAKEFVEQAKELLNKDEKVEFNLENITKFKALESYLKKFDSLSNEQKDTLEQHILNMKDRIKRKKFPFGILGKLISKDRANELADKLGLK